MAFEFSCPQCKHTMQMDNSAAGEMGVCPACSTEVLIQRGVVEVATEENQTQQEEPSQTTLASDSSGTVELGAGKTLITRLVMVVVLVGVISGGGYLIYDNAVELWEDEAPTGLSEYQKELLRQTAASKGPPDYSEYAVEQPERTEEEKKMDAEMGASGGGFGGAPTDGGQGENEGGQDTGRRSFDPAQIFADRDEDMDGLLSGSEISERMQSRVAEMDEDKDGAISKDEFVKAMTAMMAARRQSGGGGQRGGGDTERPELQNGQPQVDN